MSGPAIGDILGPDDPLPVRVFNAQGASPFLLLGDHAGSVIPAALRDLGLSAADRARHIALDIGVRGMGEALASQLDACFLHQTYSRLVVDCNRDPAGVEAMPDLADGMRVPGNIGLTDSERAARIAAIHAPYHDAIAATLDTRQARGQETILLSLHSFTPSMGGESRPWHAGVLYWRGDTGFALRLLRALEQREDMVIGDNAPYRMDATDYTVPLHAFPRGCAYAEIEVRQDLIADPAGQMRWAMILKDAARAALPASGASD
ncbi:MAG: N-formylglutamate amidohydrolase [Sphingobium sp.]|nr:N-formylglutamate amidohydrolase [Sphingobium sp.]